MVSRGYHKRACGVVLVDSVKNPIKLAREMLVRGQTDGSGNGNGGDGDPSGGSGGAQGHCCLGGVTAVRLAKEWGLEIVDKHYFATKKRWEEHKRGLGKSKAASSVCTTNSPGELKISSYGCEPHTDDRSLMKLITAVGNACWETNATESTLGEIYKWCKTSVMLSPGHREHLTESACADILQGIGRLEGYFEQVNKPCDPHSSDSRWITGWSKWVASPVSCDKDMEQEDHIEHETEEGTPVFEEKEKGWDGKEYLPQGTVGCVALDQYGTLCVATSTGGLTNKLPCRIGDTPTIGAGFFAEEWDEAPIERSVGHSQGHSESILDGLRGVMGDCLPNPLGYQQISPSQPMIYEKTQPSSKIRAIAVSGTGNGDSFLRLAAARTVGAIVRFCPNRSLASAVNQIAGPFGELQRSAGDRWGETGEGEGGIIGIDLVDGEGQPVFDFNCGGMFRCWIDEMGVERVMVFRDEY